MMSTQSPEDVTAVELTETVKELSRLQGHAMGMLEIMGLLQHGYEQARKQHPKMPAHPGNEGLLQVARIWQAKAILEDAHRKLGIRAPVVLSPIDGDLAEVTYE